jgi:rubrerythrin
MSENATAPGKRVTPDTDADFRKRTPVVYTWRCASCRMPMPYKPLVCPTCKEPS